LTDTKEEAMGVRDVGFYPDEENAKWGYLLVNADPTNESNPYEGRETWRLDDVTRVRTLKKSRDKGEKIILATGRVRIRAGWPGDWDAGTADDDDAWVEGTLRMASNRSSQYADW
jgi:hypothetical protein